MGVEIERKFRLQGAQWQQAVHRVSRMSQGYLSDAASVAAGHQNCSVRVRVVGDSGFLNIKSRALGASRLEFEYPLPLADASALLELCVGGLIDKNRHYVTHAGHLWEIDEFLGDNAGLIVAEIELDSVDEAFARPEWLGGEVTDQARYYNLALAAHPFSRWTDTEKS